MKLRASRQSQILDAFIEAMPPGKAFAIGRLYALLPSGKDRPGYSTFATYLRWAVEAGRMQHPRHGIYQRPADALVQPALPHPSLQEMGNVEIISALDTLDSLLRGISADLAVLRARLQC